MSDQLLVPDFEKILEAFCDPDGVQEFFNIRNAIRQAMRDREALLVVVKYIKRHAPILWADLEAEGLIAALPEHLIHEHDWIDISNEVISGGETCLGCGEILAALPEHLQ